MRSFTFRLTLWYALILAVILGICGATAYWGARYLLFSAAAGETANALANLRILAAGPGENGGDANHVDLDDPQLTAATENVFVQITAADGKVINKSPALKITVSPYAGPPVQRRLSGESALLAGTLLPDGTVIQVIRPFDREEKFLEALTKIFTLVSFGGLALTLAGGWTIAKAALRPVNALTKTARRISATDLGRRIELRGAKDELYILGETFNQMLDRLEKGFQSQREFVAAASHDLRTPLTVIKSYTDLLSRWGKDEPAVLAESLSAINRAAGLMERLVNDLLLMASVPARSGLHCRPLELAGLAEEMVKEGRSFGQEIAVETGRLAPVTVDGDGDYLRRALWALVDNALKYNRPEGKVTVTVDKDDREAFFVVEDTGPGIPEEDLPRIFERFYRSDKARRQGTGFGLGLALAKDIVTAHGGRIDVESQPGKGSRFTVILPLQKGDL